MIHDPQPEANALLRWHVGEWTDDDLVYAANFRQQSRAIDLDDFRRRFGPARRPLETPKELKKLVAATHSDPSLQYFLMTLLVEQLTTDHLVQKTLLRRWAGIREWPRHAWFSRHCVKTLLTFYLGLGSGIIGTRATNRVDLEYLFYLPFCSAFISGDAGSHGIMAPLLVDSDQMFISSADFRTALQNHVQKTAALRALPAPVDPDQFEPDDPSLIRDIWLKAWGYFRPPPSKQPKPKLSDKITPQSIAEEMRRAQAHIEAHPEQYPRRPAWPG